ncbi:MAG: hypothetical protein H6R07_1960 [Proteobacteria bacterium]|nr:hypothetical protein [Pseudomonadota bacterium]
MKPHPLKLLFCMVFFSLAACTSLQPPRALPSSDGLQPVASETGSALRASGHWQWASIEVDEVLWQAGTEVESEEQQQLCSVLRESLRRDLSPLAQGSGAKLRIRAQIVDVATVSPALNLATAVLIFLPVERGGAAVLIEALDAESGRGIARFSMAESGGLSDFSGHFSRYGHAEQVLKRAALAFRKILEQENDASRHQS